MTYNAAIPQASDTISASQPPILTNFFELNTVFGIDHVKFDDATLANRGHHLKVTFNDVLVADPGLLAPACSLYTKATGAGNQLFFQNALASIVQLTASGLDKTLGQALIPGGLQIRCGVANSNGAGWVNNITPNFATACIAVIVSGQNGAQPTNKISVTSISTANFTLKSSQGEACYYVAFGY